MIIQIFKHSYIINWQMEYILVVVTFMGYNKTQFDIGMH